MEWNQICSCQRKWFKGHHKDRNSNKTAASSTPPSPCFFTQGTSFGFLHPAVSALRSFDWQFSPWDSTATLVKYMDLFIYTYTSIYILHEWIADSLLSNLDRDTSWSLSIMKPPMGLHSSEVTQSISYSLLQLWFQGAVISGWQHKINNNNCLFNSLGSKETWQDVG